MKLKFPNLLKPLGTIFQQNYWSFYPSELIYFALFTMRHPVHTNICNFRGDLFKIRIQLQVLLKKFIKSNRIAETYSYQTTLKNFFFPFRSTKVSKETASLNSFQNQSFRTSIQNQRPKYSSPLQLRYPHLRYFSSYAILNWVQKNMS